MTITTNNLIQAPVNSLDFKELRSKYYHQQVDELFRNPHWKVELSYLIMSAIYQTNRSQAQQFCDEVFEIIETITELFGTDQLFLNTIVDLDQLGQRSIISVSRSFPELRKYFKTPETKVGLVKFEITPNAYYVRFEIDSKVVNNAYKELKLHNVPFVRLKHIKEFIPMIQKKVNFYSKKYGMATAQEREFLWLLEGQTDYGNRFYGWQTPRRLAINTTNNVHRVAKIAAVNCDLSRKVAAVIENLDDSLVPALATMPDEWLDNLLGMSKQ